MREGKFFCKENNGENLPGGVFNSVTSVVAIGSFCRRYWNREISRTPKAGKIAAEIFRLSSLIVWMSSLIWLKILNFFLLPYLILFFLLFFFSFSLFNFFLYHYIYFLFPCHIVFLYHYFYPFHLYVLFLYHYYLMICDKRTTK